MTPSPETKPQIIITLTDADTSTVKAEINTPNLQVAIHMLTQTLDEVKHAKGVDQAKKDAAQMMEHLRTGQLMRTLPVNLKEQ